MQQPISLGTKGLPGLRRQLTHLQEAIRHPKHNHENVYYCLSDLYYFLSAPEGFGVSPKAPEAEQLVALIYAVVSFRCKALTSSARKQADRVKDAIADLVKNQGVFG